MYCGCGWIPAVPGNKIAIYENRCAVMKNGVEDAALAVGRGGRGSICQIHEGAYGLLVVGY